MADEWIAPATALVAIGSFGTGMWWKRRDARRDDFSVLSERLNSELARIDVELQRCLEQKLHQDADLVTLRTAVARLAEAAQKDDIAALLQAVSHEATQARKAEL